MLLGTVRASLFRNLLTGKGIVQAGSGHRFLNSSTLFKNKKGKEMVRAVSGRLSSSTLYEKNEIFNTT